MPGPLHSHLEKNAKLPRFLAEHAVRDLDPGSAAAVYAAGKNGLQEFGEIRSAAVARGAAPRETPNRYRTYNRTPEQIASSTRAANTIERLKEQRDAAMDMHHIMQRRRLEAEGGARGFFQDAEHRPRSGDGMSPKLDALRTKVYGYNQDSGDRGWHGGTNYQDALAKRIGGEVKRGIVLKKDKTPLVPTHPKASVEKTADTRHLVGGALGAGAGLLHAMHRDQRVKEQDRLLEDLGQMPHDVAEDRRAQRRGAMLRDAVLGGVAGGAAGHAAPAAERFVHGRVGEAGKAYANAAADVMEARAGGIGHAQGHGAVNGMLRAAEEKGKGMAAGAMSALKSRLGFSKKANTGPTDPHRFEPGDIVVMGRNIHEPEETAIDRAWNKYAPKILGPSTHTGIVSPDGKHVIDATPKDGVRKLPFHEAVHGREWTVRRPKEEEAIRRKAAHFAEARATEKAKYSMRDWAVGTVGTALPTKLTGVLDAATEQPRKRKGYTCASLVAEAYDKKLHGLGAAATPADFHFSPKAQTVHSAHVKVPKPLGGRLAAVAAGKAPEITEGVRAVGRAVGKYGPPTAGIAVAAGGGVLGHHLLKKHREHAAANGT